jgi:nucleotide-binding universal stress UspA family protein
MARRIVVPLDGSAFAEAALPAAVRVARQTGAQVELVTVHQPQLGGASPIAAMEVDARQREQEVAYLARKAEQIVTEARLLVTTAVLDGPVVTQLAAHAQSHGAALVVMSTHGRAAVSRFFLGSTADRLIRELHCPILLVHSAQAAAALAAGETLRVLVPLDGSTLAESILDQVAAVLPEATELELVRVVVPPLATGPAVAIGWTPVAGEVLEEELARAGEYLRTVAARLRQRGFGVQAEVLTDLSPTGAIVNRAAERQCDAIAISTRATGGLERAVLGSVADKVIRAVQLPVLVWNPPSEVTARVPHPAEAAGLAGSPPVAVA